MGNLLLYSILYDVKNLYSKVKNLQLFIDNLPDDVVDLVEEVNDLSGRVDNFEISLNNLNRDFSSLSMLVGGINVNVNSLLNTVEGLSSRVNGLNDSVSVLSGQLDVLNNRVNRVFEGVLDKPNNLLLYDGDRLVASSLYTVRVDGKSKLAVNKDNDYAIGVDDNFVIYSGGSEKFFKVLSVKDNVTGGEVYSLDLSGNVRSGVLYSDYDIDLQSGSFVYGNLLRGGVSDSVVFNLRGAGTLDSTVSRSVYYNLGSVSGDVGKIYSSFVFNDGYLDVVDSSFVFGKVYGKISSSVVFGENFIDGVIDVGVNASVVAGKNNFIRCDSGGSFFEFLNSGVLGGGNFMDLGLDVDSNFNSLDSVYVSGNRNFVELSIKFGGEGGVNKVFINGFDNFRSCELDRVLYTFLYGNSNFVGVSGSIFNMVGVNVVGVNNFHVEQGFLRVNEVSVVGSGNFEVLGLDSGVDGGSVLGRFNVVGSFNNLENFGILGFNNLHLTEVGEVKGVYIVGAKNLRGKFKPRVEEAYLTGSNNMNFEESRDYSNLNYFYSKSFIFGNDNFSGGIFLGVDNADRELNKVFVSGDGNFYSVNLNYAVKEVSVSGFNNFNSFGGLSFYLDGLNVVGRNNFIGDSLGSYNGSLLLSGLSIFGDYNFNNFGCVDDGSGFWGSVIDSSVVGGNNFNKFFVSRSFFRVNVCGSHNFLKSDFGGNDSRIVMEYDTVDVYGGYNFSEWGYAGGNNRAVYMYDVFVSGRDNFSDVVLNNVAGNFQVNRVYVYGESNFNMFTLSGIGLLSSIYIHGSYNFSGTFANNGIIGLWGNMFRSFTGCKVALQDLYVNGVYNAQWCDFSGSYSYISGVYNFYGNGNTVSKFSVYNVVMFGYSCLNALGYGYSETNVSSGVISGINSLNGYGSVISNVVLSLVNSFNSYVGSILNSVVHAVGLSGISVNYLNSVVSGVNFVLSNSVNSLASVTNSGAAVSLSDCVLYSSSSFSLFNGGWFNFNRSFVGSVNSFKGTLHGGPSVNIYNVVSFLIDSYIGTKFSNIFNSVLLGRYILSNTGSNSISVDGCILLGQDLFSNRSFSGNLILNNSIFVGSLFYNSNSSSESYLDLFNNLGGGSGWVNDFIVFNTVSCSGSGSNLVVPRFLSYNYLGTGMFRTFLTGDLCLVSSSGVGGDGVVALRFRGDRILANLHIDYEGDWKIERDGGSLRIYRYESSGWQLYVEF